MRRVGIALLFSAGVLAAPGIAAASPCGGGSSGGGSSGGSSSGGGSSSSSSSSSGGGGSSSSSSSSSGCVETTSIVGRAECSHFADRWDRSWLGRLRLSMNAATTRTSMQGMGFAARAEHETSHAYHYPTDEPRAGEALQAGFGGTEFQVTGFVSQQVFVGAHTGILVGNSAAPERRQGDLRMIPRGLMQFNAGAVIGAAVPLRSGSEWSVRTDAIVGWRGTGMSVETRVADCVTHSMPWNHEWMAEARGGLQKWLTPWLSTSLMVGTDLFQERDLSLTLGLTGHTRAFDRSDAISLPRP